MVHGDKAKVRLAIINYANLKKACEFLELAGGSELMFSHTVHKKSKKNFGEHNFLIQFFQSVLTPKTIYNS